VGRADRFERDVLYARNGSTLAIDSIEGARRTKATGVVKDDIRCQYLGENNLTNLLVLLAGEECVQSQVCGEADLWLGGSETASRTALEAGVDPAELEAAYTVRKVEFYIAFNNKTPESVVAAWQETPDAMKRDGTYNAIVGIPPGSAPATGELVPAESALPDPQIMTVERSLEVIALTDDARSWEWERIRPL